MSWPVSWTGPAWQTALAQSNRKSRVDGGPGAPPSSRKLRRMQASNVRRQFKAMGLSVKYLPSDRLVVNNCRNCNLDACDPQADQLLVFASGDGLLRARVCASCAKSIERHYGRRLNEVAS